MASPLQYKMRWPSEKKANGVGGTSDFIPYVSNLANAFRKTPMPRAPKLIDPITGTHVNMDAERNDVTNATHAADLSTRDLDAQTGAAIRVGNQGNRFRALNDVNSKEASTNAQLDLHNNMINANINAQNAGMTNQYHDDITEAQIAQQRNQSENLSNAADKYIGQQTVKDQMALDKEKTTILSKMYNQGVYGRLQKSLSDSGVDIPGATNNATPGTNSFDSYKSKVGGDLPQSAYETTSMDSNSLGAMKRYMKMRDVYAAGGMMKAYAAGGDPDKPVTASGLPATGGSGVLYKPNDTYVIKDARTVNPVTGVKMAPGQKTTTAHSNDLEAIIAHAKANGVNPKDALSVAYQESNFNKTGTGYGEVKDYFPNPEVSDHFLTIDERTRNEQANTLSKALKDKLSYADRLGFSNKGDAYRLQAYNGYGKVIPHSGEKAFYGIPVSHDHPLDMKQNPAYGKTVVSLRDSVLSKNPNIQKLIDQTPAYQPMYADGGDIHIKPQNRGKFTAYKARTGKTTAEALQSSDPHVRQMANFSRNAKKWHHAMGGRMTKPFC